MADRYWVGGTANWDGTAGTKWATTSGGAGGASVPTAADDVFFDAASGTVTCTIATGNNGAKSINFTGFTGTFAGSTSLALYGSVTLATGMTYTNTGTISFFANATITTAGKTFSPITVNGSGITVELGDALTSSGTITVTQGTFTTNNFNVTAQSLSSTNSNTRTINLGSSTVTLTGAATVLSFATNTNLTFNAGTSTIVCASTNANIIGGAAGGTGVTFYNVSYTATTAGSNGLITSTNTFNNLSFTGSSSAGVRSVTFDSNQTINGTLSTTGTAGNRRVWFLSNTYGVRRTLTVNSAPSLTDADFRDIIVNGTAAPISGTRIGNRGACAGITFDAPKTVYWNRVGGGNWSTDSWASSSGGTASPDNFPLAQDIAIIENTGLNTSATVTLDNILNYIPTVNMSTRTNAMTFTFGAPTVCYGSFITGSGVTFSGTSPLTFEGQGTKIIGSGGFSCSVVINAYGGTFELDRAYNSSTRTFTVTAGTFTTNGYALTVNQFISGGSEVRTINFGASTVTTTGTAGLVNFSSTNLTFNCGTSTIIAQTGSAAINNLAGQTYYNVIIQSTNYVITGANTFNDFTVTAPGLAGVGAVRFSANQTINGTLTCAGASAVRRIFLCSDTIGTQRDLTVNTLVADDCDFRDIDILGSAAGASPTRAGDCGGNSGINFPAAKTVYWNLSGTQSWSATGWATSSGGTPAINNFPLAQDTAVFDDAGSVGDVTLNASWNIGTLDASSRTSAMGLYHNGTCTFYGNYTLGSGVSIFLTQTQTFAGRGTQTFTSAGKTITFPITVDSSTGTFQLGDAFNSSNTLTFLTGTFDAVTYNLTCTTFTANGTTGATLKMGSGTWTLSGTGNIWAVSGISTFLKGTADILLSNTTTTSRTFAGGGFSYNKLTIGGATGTSTTAITGNNQFTELASTKTVAHTIDLGAGTTQSIGTWSVTGTAGNVVSIAGTSQIQLVGSSTSGINYLSISGGTTVATGFAGPGQFFAGPNSTGGGTGFILTATPAPRTLYWVGGTGNWTSTARWSLSSGGAGGEPIPTSLDNVIFNSASNATAYTVTVDAASRCNQLTISAPASGNVTLAGSSALICHGDVTLPATGLTRTFTGNLVLSGSTTGKTFTTNGVGLSNNTTINGVGCGWTLGSAYSGGSVVVTNGSFDTGNFNVTAGALSSNNTNTRSITLGSSTVSLSTSIFSVDLRNNANLILDAGTSTFNLTASTAPGIYSTLPITLYDVVVPANSVNLFQIVAPCTFNDLTINAFTTAGFRTVELAFDIIINGTLTLSAGTNATMRTFVRSNTIGTTRTLTCNAVASLTDIDFRDITIAGSAAPVSGTRLGDCKGNSGITFDAPKTVYYRNTVSTNWSNGGSWSLTNNGSSTFAAFPLAQDTVVFPSSPTPYPSSGNTVSVDAAYNIGTIDMSARTSNTMTLATGSITPTIYGNWINGTGVTLPGPITGSLIFAGRGSQTITSAGISFPQKFVIETPGGSVTLQDNFVATEGSALTLNQGTFDANNFNVTLANNSVINAFASTGSGVRTLNMGSGTWLVRSFSTPWTVSGSNLTITGTATISFDASSTITFAGGGFSYAGITLNKAGAGTLTITGNNTFSNITTSGSGAITIALGTTTQRVANFTATGTAGNILTITGNTSNLIYTSGGTVGTGVDYLNVQGRAYGPNGEASGIWYAGANSVNSGSLGWEFTAGGSIIYNVVITEAYTSAEEQDTAANIFNSTLTENSILADEQVPAGIYAAQITENSDLADSQSPSITVFVSVTEPTTLANFQEFVNLIAVSITEGSVAGDSQVAQNAFLVNLTEGLTSADSQTSNAIFYAVAVENSNAAESQAAQAAFNTLISEGFTPADIQAASAVITRSITEGATLAEAQQAANVFLTSITEDVTSAETQNALLVLASSISENLNSAEDQTVQAVFAGSVSEGVVSAEAINVSGIFGSSILEVLTSLSQESVSLNTNAAITEGVEVTDGKEIIDWLNNSSDIVNWLNNSSDIVYWGVFGPRAVLVRFVNQAENVTLADLSERQATLSALITEALAAADSSSVSAIFNSLINENMLVSDQTVGYGWFRVVDDQTASWTSVDNSQSIVWTNIGDDQNPNWVEINNSQP